MKIFLTYSHKDEYYKDCLLVMLQSYVTSGKIKEIWHDQLIPAGENWREWTLSKIHGADVVIWLVSPDFLATDYIQNVEMIEAWEGRQRGKITIVPILIRACAWEDDQRIRQLQMLPKNRKYVSSWTDQDAAWKQIVEAIINIPKQNKPVESPPPSDELPYPKNPWVTRRRIIGSILAALLISLIVTCWPTTSLSCEDLTKRINESQRENRFDETLLGYYNQLINSKCSSQEYQDEAVLYYERGTVNQQLGYLAAAKEDYQKAHDLDPKLRSAEEKLNDLQGILKGGQ